MEIAPTISSIAERLSHAVQQAVAVFPGIGVPRDDIQMEATVNAMLENEQAWLAAVPALQDVKRWVEVHWNCERQTQPPAGTVSDGEKFGNRRGPQLDPVAAAFKLLLAAAGHGDETVAKYAIEFAGHGTIEVRALHMLKGVSVSRPQRLDDYCTLLPYRDALHEVRAHEVSAGLIEHQWPPERTVGVCALEIRRFERRGVFGSDDFERYASPLGACDLDVLMLILGLVWGKAVRQFGIAHGVAEPVEATLPFFYTGGLGRGTRQALFPLLGPMPSISERPLNAAELEALVSEYAALPEETQNMLRLALRRLRDGTEEMETEDNIIDLCIALEALFMGEGEHWDHQKLISRRASWHFADSLQEREQIRVLLKEFYDDRSAIVHGNTSSHREHVETERLVRLAAVDDVVRASVKTMICEGLPEDWDRSKDFKAIRHDPPRSEAKIPSLKSDSLSWSLKEQKEIDQALEAVWKSEIENAPTPSPDASAVTHRGILADEIERCRQQGIPYVVRVPIRLYMAHPKWPQRECDPPPDERIKHYCSKDVERHLQAWQQAASEKRMRQFELELEEPDMYLPEHFNMWNRLLNRAGL